jgi:predicted Zn-dependent protease with MMP-like domain
MDYEEFQQAIDEALRALPAPIKQHLENVQVLIQDAPTPAQQRLAKRAFLLGLYEGVPFPAKTGYEHFPDRITLFKTPLEQVSHTHDELLENIRQTIIHEVGHFIGL